MMATKKTNNGDWSHDERMQWRRWLRTLRILEPAKYPVFVTRRKLSADAGIRASCVLRTQSDGTQAFRIVVDASLPLDVAWYFLLHEWEHALTWFEGDPDIDHTDEWGQVLIGSLYARLWREFVQDGDYDRFK